MTNPARTAGPNTDGSRSLASESKTGLSVAGLVFVVLQGVLDGLTNVNLDGQGGWWVPFANAGLALATGTLAAWLKSNR
jgi:hypothetical protein